MITCLNCMSKLSEDEGVCSKCGWDGSDNEEGCLRAGTILQGRYIVGTCKNIRSADIQYIAWDALFERNVFVMEYFPENMAGRSKSGRAIVKERDKERMNSGIRCFMRQKDKLIMLDGTHGLLNVLAGFEENNTAYMILEYPGERTLRDVLEAEGPWDLKKTEKLLKNLTRPLAAVCQSNSIHGQLSLDCCYLTPQGNFKIGFFNEALFLTTREEEFQEEKARRSADCFELAHIVGAALAGVDIWLNQSVDESLEILEDRLPGCVMDVLIDAMNIDISYRIQSPQLFLDRFLDDVTVEIPKAVKK